MLDYISIQQENIVKDTSRIKKIIGCAGSRKTDTMIKTGIYQQNNSIEPFHVIYLTLVGSVSDEITSRIKQLLNINIYRYGLSNHFIGQYKNHFIEIANLDAFIHYQLQHYNYPKLFNIAQNFDKKTEILVDEIKNKNIPSFYLKNGEKVSMILIDEFQDISNIKVSIFIEYLKFNLNTKIAIFGDFLQTIFPHVLSENLHPLQLFDSLSPSEFHLNICYRCPQSHIQVVNCIMKESQELYNVLPIESYKHLKEQKDIKPLFFCHDVISNEKGSYLTALQIFHMIQTLIKYDSFIKYSDIAIIMKKSNHQNVFKYIHYLFKKNQLESFICYSKTKNIFNHRLSIDWVNNSDKLKMLSIHGDKGKGHKVVFFIGFSGNVIPEERQLLKSEEIISHSLLNVALTRSTKYLFIGMTKSNPSHYFINKYSLLENISFFAWDSNSIKNELIHKISQLVPDKPLIFRNQLRESPLFTPIKNIINIQNEENLYKFFKKLNYEKLYISSSFSCLDNEDKLYILTIFSKLLFLKKTNQEGFLKLLEPFLVFYQNQKIYYTDDIALISLVRDYQLNIKAYKDTKYWFECIKHYSFPFEYFEPFLILNPNFNSNFFNQLNELKKNSNHLKYLWNFTIFYIEYIDKVFISNLTNYLNFQHPQLSFIETNINHYLNHLNKKYKNISIQFQHSVSLFHKIEENEELLKLGFQKDMDMDKIYFVDGYKYGLTSNSDFYEKNNQIFIDFRLSNEPIYLHWIHQLLIHCQISKLCKFGNYKEIHILNINKGLLFNINTETKYNYKKILTQLFNLYQFPDLLIDKLL